MSTIFFLLQVLFLVDPVDKVAIQNLKSYKDKNFVDITKQGLDLGQLLGMLILICLLYSCLSL